MGVAKASGLPAAIVCTSGTAAANFAPAVIEAYEARLPLLVLTADRPPELREVGAGQTIDQVKLYGSAAKWYFEIDEYEASPARIRWMRQLACRAFATTLLDRPGPVHLNFSLREPLVLDQPLPERPELEGRPDERPWVVRQPPVRDLAASDLDFLTNAIRKSERPLIVAGRYDDVGKFGPSLARFAAQNEIPLLAEPLSGARMGNAAVAHYDAFLRDSTWSQDHEPDLVVRFGDLPTSKPLRLWLASLVDVTQVGIDPDGGWQDPAAVVCQFLAADPNAVLTALTSRSNAWGGIASNGSSNGSASKDGSSWLQQWLQADEHAAEAIAGMLGESLSEPLVAARLGDKLSDDTTLVVASSMPIRDVETFFTKRDSPPRVLSNRGANGIDGTVSTAFGVAAASGGPAVLLIGDVALAHDIGGLMSAERLDAPLVIVLINNDGGGIFHFLPVADAGPAFVDHVATPHGLDFGKAAELFSCGYVLTDSEESFDAALDAALIDRKTTLIEVRTNREENVLLHRRIWAAVSSIAVPST